MSNLTRDDAASLIRHVTSSLIVRQLQAILKAENLPTSGLKGPLQKRLTGYIEDLVARNDVVTFQRLKNTIYRLDATTQVPARTHSYLPPPPPPPLPVSNGYSPAPSGRANPPVYPAVGGAFSQTPSLSRIFFRESPFYIVLAPLSQHARCPAMSTHRNTITAVVTLKSQQVQQLATDKSYRCMVYCAAIEQTTGFTRDTDIAFPHQVELRVNDTLAPGLNLRGIKNKPGSTRPADITDKLTLAANYRNQISLTYAMTQKEFVFLINLVKTETVDNLVQRLRSGNDIAKETVIAELVKKNEDADLVATSTIMSLKCPLSTVRIELPVRSQFCKHVQCFDATSFLQLQLQAPTWTCPTCNRSIAFRQLVIDKYFDDILKSTPKTVESVTIDAEGKWSVAVEGTNTPVPDSSDDEGDGLKVVDLEDDDDDGLFRRNVTSSVTPATSHTRGDSLPAGRGNNSNITNKRPVSQVIDLTLSDDDEPPRPSKRRNGLPTPSSVGSGSAVSDFLRSDSAATTGSLVGTPPSYYNVYTELGWYP